jgi:hypothetical protein
METTKLAFHFRFKDVKPSGLGECYDPPVPKVLNSRLVGTCSDFSCVSFCSPVANENLHKCGVIPCPHHGLNFMLSTRSLKLDMFLITQVL